METFQPCFSSFFRSDSEFGVRNFWPSRSQFGAQALGHHELVRVNDQQGLQRFVFKFGGPRWWVSLKTRHKVPQNRTHTQIMQQGGTEANSSRGLLNAPHSSSRTSWPWPTAVTTGRDESEILGVELRTTAASSGLGDGAGSPEAKPPFDVLCGQADIETFNSMIEATCAASGLGVICLQNEADPMTLHEPSRPINSQTELES